MSNFYLSISMACLCTMHPDCITKYRLGSIHFIEQGQEPWLTQARRNSRDIVFQ